MDAGRKHVPSSWSLLVHPYYLLHTLTFASYFFLHHIALQSVIPSAHSRLIKWEIQAILSLATMLLIKYINCATLEAFLADAFSYGKGIVLLLAFMLDYRLLAWYLVIFAILFLICLQPSYSGPEKISELTPLELENHLVDGNGNVCWLVEFSTAWSPRCVRTRRLFAELSVRYSSKRIQFGRVDLSRFPNAAAKYGINFGVVVRQLPTLIFFKGGTEISRLPEPDYDGTMRKTNFNQTTIIKYFDLDRIYIESLSEKSTSIFDGQLHAF